MTEKGISIEGSESTGISIDGNEAMNECVERLFLSCRHSLTVRAPRLDFDFYFSESFTECCRSIVVRDMRNEILFLIEDEKHLMRASSRVIALARQFSSYIKIRAIPEEYVEKQETFIVCDSTAYLHQPNVEYPRGVFSESERGIARQFNLRFKDLWDRSAPPKELFTTGL